MFLDKIKQKFDLSVVKNIELEDMAIDFTGPDDWTSTLSSDHMIARLTHIPGFTWPIQQVRLRVVIHDKGIDLGQLVSPYQPASVSGGIVTSRISNSLMTIFQTSTSQAGFSEFVGALATKDHHTFVIKGSADIIFNLGFLGIHSIKGVDFLSDLTLRGLNNLPDIKCADIVIGTSATGLPEQQKPYELLLKTNLEIHNPSQLSLSLGDLTLAVFFPSTENLNQPYTIKDPRHEIIDQNKDLQRQQQEGQTQQPRQEEIQHQRQEQEQEPRQAQAQQDSDEKHEKHGMYGHYIGTIALENLSLQLGANKDCSAIIKLDTSLDGTKLFLRAIACEPQIVLLKGFQQTSKKEALAAGLRSFATSLFIPSFTPPPLPTPIKIERQ
ncbi:hypothetical protein BCR41DRAFT_418260 [Lobosporangium transversale]|uniref:Uncharacterized protein n=1 Tax=Lobosporangium transversale TaxID=64571 RepID=A0A1Y2H2B1_9FUNG|nr:hypothetical protein BCR41DRAFT_418260 [Lobosporangium transversale]ORZ28154.1 hypothetical protein BCR41DRAFT_418260 [Lobosporangium transversale]|eukprot:XP_021885839.1 hypothetical protein BCR41DRAFT_418260 [Lobosporangium transversale]